MSTPEVTPESLRAHALWLDAHCMPVEAAALRCEADRLEHEQRPLPTVPGWYPNIVVERGGESCTGTLRSDDVFWYTARAVGGRRCHLSCDETVTIRWAEQDGTTPGQTAYKADGARGEWDHAPQSVRDAYDRMGSAVLAAHSTPLTQVGEHPKPGTRGLLPGRCQRED